MTGNFVIRVGMSLSMLVMTACGQNQSAHYQDRARVERITALIDSQRYDSVIRWYEGPQSSASQKITDERYYALAKLGKGGFDPINAIPNILGMQTFQSSERARLFGNCPNVVLKSFDTPQIKCLVVRLINQLPSVDNKDFMDGVEILAKKAKEGTITDSDYTLLLILQTSIVLKRVGNILESYLYLGDHVTDEQLDFFYKQIEYAALASKTWIEQMSKSPDELSRRITGLRNVSILKNIEGKTKFIKETGIPYVLENINGENRESKAILSRVMFIQVIDSTLRDYFDIE